jgi:uncharacterized protein YggT (Ycf19 family)
MSLIDFILNLAGLLLWLNWLSLRFDPLTRPAAATLAGTLRKADNTRRRRWTLAAALAGLLLARALVYWHIGSAVNRPVSLRLGVITLSFPCDFLERMLMFSALSFMTILAGFYIWLLLLSFLGGRGGESDPFLRLARAHLGVVVRWPWPVRLILPVAVVALLWLALSPALAGMHIVPPPLSWTHRLQQAALLGLGACLAWKYLIAGLLVLHILNSYVFLGNHPFWTFITMAARSLLKPFGRLPLQLGRVDFAPLVVLAVVFLLAEYGGQSLTQLYARLPL